ncbi:MAG: response regulator transcription factor [Actinobacteria bacterium]|nr:response regulator transcription factor [Actinomycetota bacterium]
MAVLVVDDDPSLRQVLERVLSFEGYDVETAPNGFDALERCQAPEHGAAPLDLVILDLGLPDIDGLDVARKLRVSGSTVPILVLTARGDVGDRVAGLDAGADDYLPKPFDLAELIARVRALLRRTSPNGGSAVLTLGDLTLDSARRQVTREGEEIVLTKTEFALLQVLLEATGTVVERGALMSEVWGFSSPTLDSNLDTYVSYVRRKTEAGGRTRLVHTVRGVGFVARVE